MDAAILGIILSTILSGLSSLGIAIVLFTLRTMNTRITNLEANHQRLVERKQACQTDFVSVEQFVRNETYTRTRLDQIAANMSDLAGSVRVVDRLPEIASSIARATVREVSAQVKESSV